jgi:aspartate/methionine/tyrosine aminotransferase
MRWAKAFLDPADPLNLGLSGVSGPTPGEIPALRPPAEGQVGDPEARLKAALAERLGSRPESIHLASGTSHANFIAWLAFARGGRVAAETPAYEALQRLALAVGASLTTFRRDPARGWRIDARSLSEAALPGTSLIAVTDLHNPSGARLAPEDLDLLVRTAERVDALVLVDEVYLDFDPEDRPSAALRSPRVLSTNSLTKAHGFGDWRMGWVLGDPARIRAIDEWDDLVCPRLPRLPMWEALAYLPHAPARLARVRAEAGARIEQVDAWVRSRRDAWWTRPAGGLTGFVRLGTHDRPLDGDVVARRLHEEAKVRVVPGSFFQMPGWIRLSFGLPADRLARALDALGATLDRLR